MSSGCGPLDGGVLPSVVGGVAVLAVQLAAAHAHVGAPPTVPQRRAAHRAREAPHVVAQRQGRDDHGGAATWWGKVWIY